MVNFKYAMKLLLFFLASSFISACCDQARVETSTQTDDMSFLEGTSAQTDNMSFMEEATPLKSEESREDLPKTDPRKYADSIENAYACLLPFSPNDTEIGRIMTEEVLFDFNNYKVKFQNEESNLETIVWLMNMNVFLTDTYIFQDTLSLDFSDLNAAEWTVLSCDYFQSLSELEEMLYTVYEKPFADYIISQNIFSEKEGKMILHYPGNWTYDVFRNRTYIRIDRIDDNECEFTWFYPDYEDEKWFIAEKRGLAVCCEGKWKLAYMLYANPEMSIENYRAGLYRQ